MWNVIDHQADKSKQTMTRIAIIDDKPSIRKLIKGKIASRSDWRVVLEAANGREFLDMARALDADQLPDIALMDIEMPEMNGIDAISVGAVLYPSIKFIVLTVFDDDDKIFEAIKSGASGYLLKDESTDVIQQLISDIMEMTGSPMSPSIARKALQLLNRAALPTKENTKNIEPLAILTNREKQILSLQVEGCDYREIGEQLHISHNTVRTHICNIYEKLHVTSKAQAVHIAIVHGINK